MGTDLQGWVEVRRHDTWYGVIKAGNIVRRNYDMFSSLFGVRPFAEFVPVAGGRGLPADISDDASEDYIGWEYVLGETWISWREIQAIDWEEAAFDTRRDGLTTRRVVLEMADDWQLMIRLMAELAAQYGEEQVRMVVWFDH